MLPAERRDVRQEIQRRDLAGFHQAGHDFAQFPAVPVDDDGGEQIERRDPVVLAFAGAIADLAGSIRTSPTFASASPPIPGSVPGGGCVRSGTKATAAATPPSP